MSNVKKDSWFSFIKLCYVLFSLLFGSNSFGQNGPGGIGNTYGNSPLLLWLDATQINNLAHGNNLSLWPDLSGYGNHAVQNNSNKPNYYTNQLNGQPTVAFDGTNAAMEGQLHTSATAPLTIVTLAKFHAVNQGANDNDYILSLGGGTATGQHTSIARRKSDTPADINKYYSWDGTAVQFGPVINGNSWILFEQVLDTMLPYHQLWMNGTPQTVSDFTIPFQSNGAFHIGKWIQLYQHHLDGEIAELLIFSKRLNDAETAIIRSYFSAKYNIPVSGDKYTGDDIINGNNDYNVAGIGKALNGTQTASSSGALTICIDSNFQQGDYVVFGNQNQAHAINTLDATDGSGRLKARWENSWFFDLTNSGSPIQVNLHFNIEHTTLKGSFSGEPKNYMLLHRAGTSGNWTLVDSASYYLNNRLYFEHTIVVNDGYYTLGTLDINNSSLGTVNNSAVNDGPGGIGSTSENSSLKMWLNANDVAGNSNDLVITWPDRTHHENNAVQTNYVELPNLQAQAVNGSSAIRFDGNNDYMQGNFSTALEAPCTIIIPAFFGKLNQANNDNAYLMSIGQNGAPNEHIGLSRRRGNVANDANKYYSYDGSTTRFGPVLPGQQWTILTQQMDTAPPYHLLFINNQVQSVNDYTAPFSTSATNFRLGRYVGNNTGNYLTGDIGEVIVYDQLLNSASLNILHAALSARYNIPIFNDNYSGDDTLNGNHDYEVAGIGQEADGNHSQCATAGLHASIKSNFQNGDYLLIGKVRDTNTIQLTDIDHVPPVIEARWTRAWWLDITNTGAPIHVDITFDFSETGINELPEGDPTGYHLLYRSGSSGNWTTVANGSAISGDQLIFSDVTLTNDGYYTLGTGNLTENPLGPNLDFGNGVWNVHVFEGTAFIRHKGSYVHDTLHFDSRALWPASGSPSSAATYSGALAPDDFHSITYKRRSFPCGNYQIDIDAHKDSATLLINGSMVWQHGGCCDAHSNVWSGQLDGESEVELRWVAATGDSYLAAHFNPITTENKWLGNSSNWFDAANWSLSSIPTGGSQVYIPAATPNPPEIDLPGAMCNNITIKAGSQFTITAGGTLEVTGNWHNQSRKVAIEGRLKMTGNCTTNSISNVYQQTINTLEIDHTGQVILMENRLNIENELTLTAGTLHSGNLLTIGSTKEGTACVNSITGDSITGNVIVERYIDAGATNWRFLSTPVSNITFSEWNDDFITSGFPGSDFPLFPFISIYQYKETTTGTKDNGYLGLAGVDAAMNPGEGYWVWCGDQLSGTQPFTIDIEGQLNQGNINLPVSFTSSAGNADDGWNLVGNPYAANIDWDAPFWAKTNLNNAIYIWNPDLQQYAAYVSGIGINGGSNLIASSQAFWVQANGTNPVLQANEQIKTSSETQFLRKKPTKTQRLIITLSGQGYYSDQTLIYPDNQASMAYDEPLDARKLHSTHSKALSLHTIAGQEAFSINAIPVLSTDTSLLLKATVPNRGHYSFEIKNNIDNAWSCIQLTDLLTGTTYSLNSDTTLTFYLSDTTKLPRFKIHFGGKIIQQFSAPSCLNTSDGSITVKGNGSGPWQYTLRNQNKPGDFKTVTSFDSVLFAQLTPAPYQVEVKNNGYCGTTTSNIDLLAANTLKANFSYIADTTNGAQAIEVQFENKSVNASHYEWDFGNGTHSSEINPLARYTQNGPFNTVLIAEKENCIDTMTKQITIGHLSGITTLNKRMVFDAQVIGDDAIIRIETDNSKSGMLHVHNASGQLLTTVTIYPGKQHFRIHLGAVAPGLLNFTLHRGSERFALKRIKMVTN